MPIDAASLAPKLTAALRDFSSGLHDTDTGTWDSNYLWDPAVMSVRGKAGSVQKLLLRMKQVDPTLFESLPKELADQWDGQFGRLKELLATIHLDGTGSYRDGLTDFDNFSTRVNEHVQAQLAARAKSAAVADALRGSDLASASDLQTTRIETTTTETTRTETTTDVPTTTASTTAPQRQMTAGGHDLETI